MIRRLGLQFRVARELGFRSISNYVLYQLGLRTGHYQRILKQSLAEIDDSIAFVSPLLNVSHTWIEAAKKNLLLLNTQVEQILTGSIPLYGADPVEITFDAPLPEQDRSLWQFPKGSDVDVKDYWEPARFGWAVRLAQAYRSKPDSRLAGFFWQKVEEFNRVAVPYQGIHWVSAQEAALRLIQMVFCADAFSIDPESTPDRMRLFSKMMQEHAVRIPPTLPYAKAQRNNHLLSEAAGLFTAGIALPNHPLASQWMDQGWKEFERAILDQIADDGTYAQHSVCYHRLMLTLALWMNSIRGNRDFSPPVKEKLGLAAIWLKRLVVGENGDVPNFGSNDGSLILPFGGEEVTNYQVVAEVALSQFAKDRDVECLENKAGIQRVDGKDSTLFFYCQKISSRPAHADQLHVDLWWRGKNILRDPGTYRYNAQDPWENVLAGTDVHNTLTIDDLDQMERVGKFLWANWASGRLIQPEEKNKIDIFQVAGEHDGYAHQNIKHCRKVNYRSHNTWQIQDDIIPLRSTRPNYLTKIDLHWQLPDAQPLEMSGKESHWQLNQNEFQFQSANCKVIISPRVENPNCNLHMAVFRAGVCVSGKMPGKPYWGWFSRTYSHKMPAISLVYTFSEIPPITIITDISLQEV